MPLSLGGPAGAVDSMLTCEDKGLEIPSLQTVETDEHSRPKGMLQRVRIPSIDCETATDQTSKPQDDSNKARPAGSVGPTIRHCVGMLRDIASSKSAAEQQRDIVGSLFQKYMSIQAPVAKEKMRHLDCDIEVDASDDISFVKQVYTVDRPGDDEFKWIEVGKTVEIGSRVVA